MKKIFSLITLVGVLLGITACSTMNSTAYTTGAVQSARLKKRLLSATYVKSDTPTVVCITPIIDLRNRSEDIHRLWMCAVPGLSVLSVWEKPDWLNWDTTYYAGYKPFCVDLTEVVQAELQQAGICGSVARENEPCNPDLILEGSVAELTLTLHPHFFGTSYIIGEPLGLLGLPMGNWDVVQQLNFRLVNRASNKVLWQKTYATKANGLIAMYYGKNPMSHGYPYAEMLEPVLKDIVANVATYATDSAISSPSSVTAENPTVQKTSIAAVKAPSTVAAAQTMDATDQLKKLKELKDAGLLTEEEYETKRKELVGQL